jgi:hypothetical protein
LEGHLAILLGCKVPYQTRFRPGRQERAHWHQLSAEFRRQAERALDVKQALELLRKPGWSWEKYEPQETRTALQL